MNFARAIHFDESDVKDFHSPARTGEWCISGGFEFSSWGQNDLEGKARLSFASGWLGLETFGRVTYVAISDIEPAELERITQNLAEHFVQFYGAPSVESALGVARAEITDMSDLCDGHAPNTLLTVTRQLAETGVAEAFRAITPQEAELDILAVQGSFDD